MKPINFLFGFLLLLLLLIGISFFLPDAYRATATIHPLESMETPALLKSTGGLKDHPATLWLGYLISLLFIGVMGSCVLLGVSKKGQVGPYLPWLSAGLGGFALIFSGLAFSYGQYTNGHSSAFFGGFPAPTAWMMYGVWCFPLLIIALFIFTFDKWFLSPQDLQQFREMVEASQEEEGGNSHV